MLREITWREFLEWRAYEELEPFPSERADWNAARIAQALIRDGKPLADFMLAFGDYVVKVETQSVEHQERILDAWIIGSNAIIEAKANRGS